MTTMTAKPLCTVIQTIFNENRLTTQDVAAAFLKTDDLSAPMRRFLSVYLASLVDAGYGDVESVSTGDAKYTAPNNPSHYRTPDGKIISAIERYQVLTYDVKAKIKDSNYDKRYGYGYNRSYGQYDRPVTPMTREQILQTYGEKVLAMWEAVPHTLVPVGTPLASLLTDEKFDTCFQTLPELSSGMNSRFHPAQNLSDLLTPSRLNDLTTLCGMLNITVSPTLCNSWIEFANVLACIRKLLRLETSGRTLVDQKRSGSKNTVRVVWDTPTLEERKTLPKGVQTVRGWKKWMEFVGVLVGRWNNMMLPSLKAVGSMLDKTGIFAACVATFSVDTLDTNTMIFCLLARAKMACRKAFTLTPQIQGTLDKYMTTLYKEVLIPSKTTQWILVASLLPIQEVLERCDLQDKSNMLMQWVRVVLAIRQPLQFLWGSGVDAAAQRQMLVPRGVDTTAWNALSGAWNNARRHMASLSTSLGIEMPVPIFKCMKVTAGDQMSWASGTDKGVDKDVVVFGILAAAGHTPWCAIDDTKMTFASLTAEIEQACVTAGVPAEKWRMGGVAKMRMRQVAGDSDMINGCVVADVGEAMPSGLLSVCKMLGIFGATHWTGL